MIYSSAITAAPYPGLRSFRRDEFDVFFGRDDHVAEMIDKLKSSHFLCVTGPSGSGKSSLARTGLLNGLEAGFLPGRGSDWIFCDFRPQDDPLRKLCEALSSAIVTEETLAGQNPEDEEQITELTNLFASHIVSRSGDLNEALDRIPAVADRPVVVLVDQFEEIFRYAQSDRHAASRFVDVLLKTMAARSNIYVVITIRTDELARCARYAGLTDAINASQFLTPTLDRFQMQEAIEGPISMFDGTIDPKFSVWLLNGLEDELDKLPLMQHALMLCFERKEKHPERPICITVKDFLSVFDLNAENDGTLVGRNVLQLSLSRRLDKIHNNLNLKQQGDARRMFCALTTIGSGRRDIRHPMKLSDLADMIGLSMGETRQLISPFRDGNVSYIISSSLGEIQPDDVIDVAHECILRLWGKLQDEWLPNEVQSIEDLRSLAGRLRLRHIAMEKSATAKLRGTELLSGYSFVRYQNWWDNQKPSRAWVAHFLGETEKAAPLESSDTNGMKVSYGQLAKFLKTSRSYSLKFRIVSAAFALCLFFSIVAGSYYSVLKIAEAKAISAANLEIVETKRAAEAEAAKAKAKAELDLSEAASAAELKIAETKRVAEAEAAKAKLELSEAASTAALEIAETKRVAEAEAAEAEARAKLELSEAASTAELKIAETKRVAEAAAAEAKAAKELSETVAKAQARQDETDQIAKAMNAVLASKALVSAVVPSSTSDRPIEILQSAFSAQIGLLETSTEGGLLLKNGEKAQVSDKIADEYGSTRLQSETNLWESLAYSWEFARFRHNVEELTQKIYGAAFISNGARTPADVRLVTLAADGKLRFWDGDNFLNPTAVITVFDKDAFIVGGKPLAFATSNDGSIAVGTNTGALALLSADNKATQGYSTVILRAGSRVEPKVSDPNAQSTAVHGLAFSQDADLLISGTRDGSLTIWSRETSGSKPQWTVESDLSIEQIYKHGELNEPRLSGAKRIHSVDIDSDGQTIALGLNNGVVCLLARNGSFSLKDWQVDCSGEGHAPNRTISAVRFEPKGTRFLSGGSDDRAMVWNTIGPSIATSRLLAPSDAVLWQTSDVQYIRFSPDGKYLTISDRSGAINFYENGNWRPLQSLLGHEDRINAIAFDATSQLLLSASSDGTARIWTPFASRGVDLASSFQLQQFSGEGGTSRLQDVALGKNANWVALATTKAIWVKMGKEPTQQIWAQSDELFPKDIQRQLVSPEGRDLLFASFREPHVTIFVPPDSVETEWELFEIKLPGDRVGSRQIAVNRDGTALAAVLAIPDDNGLDILICDIDKPADQMFCDTTQTPFEFHRIEESLGRNEECMSSNSTTSTRSFGVKVMELYENNLLAVGGTDCLVRIYDLDSDDPSPKLFPGHTDTVTSLSFSDDGTKVVSGSADGTARVWNIKTKTDTKLLSHNSRITGAQYSPSGNTISTVSTDEQFIIWDAETLEQKVSLPLHNTSIEDLDFSKVADQILAATVTETGRVNVIPYFEVATELERYADGVLSKFVLENQH